MVARVHRAHSLIARPTSPESNFAHCFRMNNYHRTAFFLRTGLREIPDRDGRVASILPLLHHHLPETAGHTAPESGAPRQCFCTEIFATTRKTSKLADVFEQKGRNALNRE